MTVTTEGPAAGSPASGPDPSGDEASYSTTNVPRMLIGLVGMIATGYVMWTVFLTFGLFPEIYLDNKLVIGSSRSRWAWAGPASCSSSSTC